MDKNNSFNLRAWLWGKMTSLYPKYLKWHFKMDIGENAVIARTAGAVVTKNAPPNSIIAGNPAVVIKTGVVISDGGQIIERGEKI